MPSNLSADERAAVEKVRDALDRKDLSDKELVVFDDEPLYPGSLFKPGEPVTYGDLRTLLAVVARAGEAVADASKNIAIGKRLTVFARELGRDHPRYITLLNAAVALEMSAIAHPADARDRGDASADVQKLRQEAIDLYWETCTGNAMAEARVDALIAAVRAERDADTRRIDWMEEQANPHHGVILCAQVVPGETPWASVQRVDQHHNPHKVEWCHEGADLRAAIDHAMHAAPAAPEDK